MAELGEVALFGDPSTLGAHEGGENVVKNYPVYVYGIASVKMEEKTIANTVCE